MKRLLVLLLMFAPAAWAAPITPTPSPNLWVCYNSSAGYIPVNAIAAGNAVLPIPAPRLAVGENTNGSYYALSCDSSGNLTPGGAAGGDLGGTYPDPTVVGINGTVLSGLASGLLYNTTSTGVPSIATSAQVQTAIGSGVYDAAGAASSLLSGTETVSGTWTFNNGSLKLAGSSSGSLTVEAAAAAGSGVDVLPAAVNSPAKIPQVVFAGTIALSTSSISTGTCQAVSAGTTNSVAATNVATTDIIDWSPQVSLQGVTGYEVNTGGALSIDTYPTAGYINVNICNWTTGSITPGALTLNVRVIR